MITIFPFRQVKTHMRSAPFTNLDWMDLQGVSMETVWNSNVCLLMNEDATDALVLKDRYEGTTGYLIPKERLGAFINKRIEQGI